MAKNKFTVVYATLKNKVYIPNEEAEFDIPIKKLPTFKEPLFSNSELYLVVYGNMDLSGIITRTSQDFDVSFFKKMLVVGNFICSKYSKDFPFYVSECFDCSGMDKGWIDKNFKFPITKKINCAYSINNFDDLIGLLPPKLEELIVEPKLIKYDFVKQNADIVISFLNKYPNVTVMYTHGEYLKDTIEKIIINEKKKETAFSEDRQKREELGARLKKIGNFLQKTANEHPEKNQELLYYYQKKIHEPLYIKNDVSFYTSLIEGLESVTISKERFFQELEKMIKTEGVHLDVQDIFAIFRVDADFEDLSNDELMRQIRHILSEQRNNGIKKQVLHRFSDNADVVCVFASQLPQIHADLIKFITQSKEKTQKKSKEKTPIVEFVPEPERTPTETKIEPIVIKKYIKKSQYDKVKASSPSNVVALLQDIKDINFNPLDMGTEQGKVWKVINGKLVKAKKTYKKSGCCITQSIDGANCNDKKRLIWQVADGPNGVIFVCMYFIPDHGDDRTSKRTEYNKLCEEVAEKHIYTEADLSGYVDIDILLKPDGDRTYSGNGTSPNIPPEDFQR
ncbi:MAG: hypothetical protein J6S57_02365 [Alphaproteobacteria bacterium]|nr:hypothetical protein [Alphaproteobacteria bacterium]